MRGLDVYTAIEVAFTECPSTTNRFDNVPSDSTPSSSKRPVRGFKRSGERVARRRVLPCEDGTKESTRPEWRQTNYFGPR